MRARALTRPFSLRRLTRSSQIGEFYIMQPPQVQPPTGGSKFTCDMLLYDEESDRHVRITWLDALKASGVGELVVSNPTTVLSGPTAGSDTLLQWFESALYWAAYSADSDLYLDAGTGKITTAQPSGMSGTASFGGGKIGGGKIAKPTTYDISKVNCRLVVARPFIEHLMHSVILTVSGRDTGATLFGPADMQLSANTQVKTIEGHYTGHFKAVITKPQNVLVMRDVACSGYVTGCNTTWFAEGDAPGVYSLQSAATNIMKRLSFADDAGARYGSMLSYPAFDEQFRSGHLDTVMSITTRLLPWEVTSATGGDHNSFPGGENMFKLYQQQLNLRQVHFGEDMKAAENQDFISQGSTNNATCFLGPHRVYDPFTKSFMNLIPGQGHFGPDAIPGDARWRRGESVSLKTARDTLVPLELAQHAQMVYTQRS